MDFLPEVKMDFIPSDDEDEKEIETIEEFNEDKDKSQEEIAEQDDLIEEVVPRAKSKRDDMNINEIFSGLPQGEVKLTKKGKPRKKRPPMTEEHKEKLKMAREKAMLARKNNAKERKENKQLEKEEKELLKKQKIKRVKQLKEEVEIDEDETPIKKVAEKSISFTKEDLQEAQLEAIMNYEKIRKARKEEKRKVQEKQKEHQILKQKIMRAVAPPEPEYNPFQNCY
tara:strand:- start:516 stop:1193 length:678 start_codon:yes stop_codon:yes gene_type:complete